MKTKNVVGFVLVVAFLSLTPILSASEISGRLEILTVCQEKKSETFFSINTGKEKERISLLIANPKIISDLQKAGPGANVKIKGFWEKPQKNGDGHRNQGFVCQEIVSCEQSSRDLPVKKDGEPVVENLLSVVVEFSDIIAPALTEENVKTAVEKGLNPYVQEVSEGLFSIKGEVLEKRIEMPETAAYYGHGSSIPMAMVVGMIEIVDKVMPIIDQSYDLAKINRIAVILSGNQWHYALGTVGRWLHWTDDGPVELSWIWLDHRTVGPDRNYFVLFHESFHNGLGGVGLYHAAGMSQKEGYCQYCEQTECPVYEYGNPSDIMGGDGRSKIAHPSMRGKKKMGLAGGGRIKTVSRNETVRIIPRASATSGIKEIKVLFEDGYYPKYYSFEYCYPVGFDVSAAFNDLVLLNVYYEGFLIEYIGETLLLKSNEAPLDLEEGFCDPRIGLFARVVGKGGSGEEAWADVEITLPEPPPPPPCEEKTSVVSASSETTEIYAGESFTCDVSVENPMTENCGTRTVNVEADLPTAWSAVFSPASSLEMAPMSTGAVSALVDIPESAYSGSYDIVFRARDSETGLENEAGLTVTVLPKPPPPCEAEKIAVSPPILTLKIGGTGDIAVSLTGAEGCPVEGMTVTATVILGKKRISLPFSSGGTDENGSVVFNITGKNKGRAIMLFQADSLKILAIVKVAKK